MLENDDKQGSGNNDNNSSSSQNQETHRDGSVTVVKTENQQLQHTELYKQLRKIFLSLSNLMNCS